MGFDEHPLEGDVAHSIQQRCTSAFVAEPARDSDVKIQIEVRMQLVWSSGEAVSNPATQLITNRFKKAQKFFVRIALV